MPRASLIARVVATVVLVAVPGGLATAGFGFSTHGTPPFPSVVAVGSRTEETAPATTEHGLAGPGSDAGSNELEEGELRILRATRRMYEEAGLEFPNAEIRFHPDTDPCQGNNGYYRGFSDGSQRVDVCHSPDSPQFADIQRTRILWHELAHAYLELRLPDDTKAAFLERYGLASWSEGEWDELGSEYAAETLVWGISGGRYTLHSRLRAVECETLAAGYGILTGSEAPEC